MTDLTPDVLGDGTALLLPEQVLVPGGAVGGHAVVVADGRFAAVGPAEEVRPQFPSLTPRRLDGHLLMPGFVDTHHHLTQSLGGALAFGEPSEIFRRVWVPLEHALDDDTAYLSAKLAALQSLRGGFTTVAEAGTRAPVDVDVIATATREAGLRCILGLTCNDADGAPAKHDVAERHLATYASDELVHPSLAIAVPEAATERTLRTTAALAAEAGAVVQIHVNEHLAGVERCLVQRGLRPIEYLHQLGVLGPQLLGAHATLVTPAELRLLRDSGAAISYNPVASAWKGNAVAPALMMRELGIRFGLGTDGTRGDGFRLLDAAETAQRIGHGMAVGDSSCGGGLTWLDHATRSGADAVGLGAVTGEIAVGKAADFLLVDLAAPELRPGCDVPWQLVRLAGSAQLTAVVVAGDVRLWRGWPLDWDGPALVDQASKAAADVVGRAGITRAHPTSAEHWARKGEP
ncbi:MAG: amidohydrolase family protein [Actinophytocola sp.]|nr:amidohydrolase family protein [Actinophytocola sp.]